MPYTYGTGQRPLDGYTLKRALGRGGFGEVYYAVSDGGKEVALKLVRGEGRAVELRGIAHCMNIKHPNLVGVYDLKVDSHGDHWIVMEYVAGETLSQLLARHPTGLPVEQAVELFRQLAAGVSHLHDHGLVHRDLKPANLFVEMGTLKVGDYGLSKPVDTSTAGHTAQVGTVHYMAPEVRHGNYGRSVDIYACGIMLYELLTGRVPFDGVSHSEILMKHMADAPDLAPVPAAFVPVVRRALLKDPEQRYQTMNEFVSDVLAAEAGPRREAMSVAPTPLTIAVPRPDRTLPPLVRPVESAWRNRLGDGCGSLASAALASAITALCWAALTRNDDPVAIGTVYLLTVATAWAVLLPSQFWSSQRGDFLGRRIVLAGLGVGLGLFAAWLGGWEPRLLTTLSDPSIEPSLARPVSQTPTGDWIRNATQATGSYIAFFALALGAMRWWKLTDRRRSRPVRLSGVLAGVFWGLVLSSVWPLGWAGPVALASAALVVQWVSPWQMPAPVPTSPKRLRWRSVVNR